MFLGQSTFLWHCNLHSGVGELFPNLTKCGCGGWGVGNLWFTLISSGMIRNTLRSYHVVKSRQAPALIWIVRLKTSWFDFGLVSNKYFPGVCSQVTALVAGFVCKLHTSFSNAVYLKQLVQIGFLAHFESLLTTNGMKCYVFFHLGFYRQSKEKALWVSLISFL